jgi:hypothetical protein
MTDRPPSERASIRSIRLTSLQRNIVAACIVVFVLATVVPLAFSSSAAFTPNKLAYCAAGKALESAAPQPHGTPTQDELSWNKAAADYGRLAASAPNEKVSRAFAALERAYTAQMTDQKGLSALDGATPSTSATAYSDATTRRTGSALRTAYSAANKSAAAECGANSTFAFIAQLAAKAAAKYRLEATMSPNQKITYELAYDASRTRVPGSTLTLKNFVAIAKGADSRVSTATVDGLDARLTFASGPPVCVTNPYAPGPGPTIVACP